MMDCGGRLRGPHTAKPQAKRCQSRYAAGNYRNTRQNTLLDAVACRCAPRGPEPGQSARSFAISTENDDPRRQQLALWLGSLATVPELQPQSLRPASSDASFRRYFRVDAAAGGVTYIAMDAPPPREDCRPFVQVAALMAASGVSTPRVLASDLERGFLLLQDFGDTTYADAQRQDPDGTQGRYEDALRALVRLQQARRGTVPAYDAPRLLAEMRLFTDWYVARHLRCTLSDAEHQVLESAFAQLVAAALAQAPVLVHRDFHCRNLMVLPGADNPGVLDFQDAVIGPVSYDLVSLLRDAYVEWPEAQQIDWAARYWDLARAGGIALPQRFDAFWQDLEWMGLQRSLKILGIFARLNYRDGKSRYLDDLPLVLRHTQRVLERYDRFTPLLRLFDRLHQRSRETGFTF